MHNSGNVASMLVVAFCISSLLLGYVWASSEYVSEELAWNKKCAGRNQTACDMGVVCEWREGACSRSSAPAVKACVTGIMYLLLMLISYGTFCFLAREEPERWSTMFHMVQGQCFFLAVACAVFAASSGDVAGILVCISCLGVGIPAGYFFFKNVAARMRYHVTSDQEEIPTDEKSAA